MMSHQETVARVHEYVSALAAWDYPKVWVGEYGITADEQLRRQKSNEEFPSLAVEPGELVEIEGTGHGLTIPSMSADWIDGLYVVEHLMDEVPEDQAPELYVHVREIWAAKRGCVYVLQAWDVDFRPMGVLTDEDRCVAKAFTDDGFVLVPGSPVYRRIAVENLRPEDVDEELVERLEFYARGEPVVAPGYVVPDNERTRRAVDARLDE